MCDTCGFKRQHMEPFINISLSLPINKGNAKSSSSRKYNEPRDGSGTRRQTQKIDVKTCIDHFSDPEPLADAVYCEWCKAKTKTKKQHTFAKLPTILCLHLKRFDAVTNKKIDEPVSFPSVLDMGPYLPHWREVEQTDVMTRDNEGAATATKTTREKSASSPSILYDLCSTINHSGTLFQGHYISNVKVDNDWYSCSDADVQRYSKESAEKDVLENGEAYMLFYMRKT
jgi:ubiquitin carboxyl-terminal hydrolase 22/27/51